MKKFWTTLLLMSMILVATPLFAAGPSWNYYLQAGVTTIPAGTYSAGIPSENILMWGYALCLDSNFTTCGKPAPGGRMPPVSAADIVVGPPTFPGPALVASEGDTLNITLKNNVTTAAGTTAGFPSMIIEPTSLIIPGQRATLTPVWVEVDANGVPTGTTYTGSAYRPGGNSTARVRSFTTETPSGGTSAAPYTWSNLKAGTYLYETGTHPAVQVQMGLYGALKVYPLNYHATPGNPAPSSGPVAGFAYDDASTAFTYETTLLYSEIDPELHYSIGSGLYGTPSPAPPGVPVRGQMTSTVEYHPKFFLINGLPFRSAALSTIAGVGTHGQKTLIRFLNAGLKEKTPTILNQYMKIIADDGNLLTYTVISRGVPTTFPYAKTQYSTLLPAGKTVDAIITPPAAGSLPVFDRSLNLTDGAAQIPGGMLVYLGIL